MERTLDYVNPQPRAWENNEGKTFYFVEGIFDDGESGSVFCFSQANADETMEALKKLIGASYEYELEKAKIYNGVQQWKIKNFPGKPAGGGGGGSRSGGGGMSHAQVGLLAAATVLAPSYGDVEVATVVKFAEVVELGEMFTEHLFSRRKSDGDAETSAPSAESHTSAPVAPADAITLPQMKRLKELGALRGLATPEAIANELAVEKLGDLHTDDAQLAIDAWSE